MPTASEIREIVHDYIDRMCAGDIDGIMAHFADDATVEDPVGGQLQQGKEAVRAFYSFAAPALQVELQGPICVAGNQCAFPLLAKLSMNDTVSYLDATDVFSFDDQGRITSMRAFWSMEELRNSP